MTAKELRRILFEVREISKQTGELITVKELRAKLFDIDDQNAELTLEVIGDLFLD